jgi:endonuclease/exonuclease/phosphatase family metal-dependent hydrolase
MSILRAMTYALSGADADLVAVGRIIRSQRPELVFLQYLGTGQLETLAGETALEAFGGDGGCGFLSCHPLTAVQSCILKDSGDCLRADMDLGGKRIHLFNLQLASDPACRGQQLARLFDADMLGATLPCATLIGGDFSIPLWGGGQWLLRRKLTPARHPAWGWGRSFPSRLPLWPRDRFYLRGPIRSLAGQVVASPETRQLSTHLPVVVSLELTDTREYLRVPEVGKSRMRPAVS